MYGIDILFIRDWSPACRRSPGEQRYEVCHAWKSQAVSTQLKYREGPRGAGDGLRKAGCVHTRRVSYIFPSCSGEPFKIFK